MNVDEETRYWAEVVMHQAKSSTDPRSWSRAEVLALVSEIERLQREPTPELTFWLGADA